MSCPRVPVALSSFDAVLFASAVCLVAAPASAQLHWTLHHPVHHPSPRVHAAVAYDAVHSEAVLFGGDGNLGVQLGDTWVWNGLDWTQRSPWNPPQPRTLAMMAFDAARNQVVLFGGQSSTGATLADTWRWNGTDWQLLWPAHWPGPRTQAAFAFDASRAEIVMFGGRVPGVGVHGDTFVWDGIDWTGRLPMHAPSPRYAGAMAYDAVRGEVVLFGGRNQDMTIVLDDTWTWDGVDWTQRFPATVPQARDEHGMVYDSARQRIVMIGGGNVSTNWQWDGVDWQLIDFGISMRGSAVAFDVANAETLVFGGEWIGVPRDDTRTYGAGYLATYAPFGAGCPGWAGTPWLASDPQRPIVGQVFRVGVYNLPPDHSTIMAIGWTALSWLGLPLPLDLGPMGAPGCNLWISPDVLQPVFNWAGYATWDIAIPNDPALRGMRFYNQATAIDHANALGLIFTNAGMAELGDH